jgi:AcrR family transcriptional regulator
VSGPAPGAEPADPLAAHRHGRVPRELRERQLLDLATELFSERGYSGTSMDALAERAGVTKPVIYNLFGSKAGLFAACTSELGERLFETVAGAVAGIDDIDELVRAGSLAFFDFIRENAGLWTAAYGTGDATKSASEQVTAELQQIRGRQNALVQTVIEAAAARLGAELEPWQLEATTRGLNGMYEGLATWAIENPDVPVARLGEWVVAVVLPGLRSLGENPGG